LKVYRDAVITNVLNPKVALFFISFLPQFINPALKNTLVPFLTLGLTFITTGTVWCLILTNFAAVIFSQLRDNKKVSTLLNKISGMALIGLGIKLAFTDKK
jgi:threonine/homoserine/homoserine lactone efflux protein